ncbi:uncharacterized protein LOC124633699 [Helicoverpa zea]|uniref:uncharacterized protein LOC124633699 n=1 Tax=Helicoverpa zea TaxID=7113 RepID=UPI001F5ACA53|nr:uncharacterized protein LOC124633699 [Helicoverpa zea]
MANVIGVLSSFDHDAQDWRIFKGRLEQFIKLNAIKSESKSALLLTHLSDNSYRLARNLLHPAVLEEVAFEDLVKKLDQHFTPKRCTFADREKFYEAKKSEGESVEEWAARVRGLAVDCEFGEALDMMLRDRFILGLAPCRERDRLFEENASKLTFAKALEVAQQAAYARLARSKAPAGSDSAASIVKATQIKEEPVYRLSGQRARGGSAAAPAPARSSDNSSGEVRRCMVCGFKSHDAEKCRFKNYRCQVCNTVGHLKKMCTKRKGEPRLNCLNTEADSSDCEECEVYSLRCARDERLAC